MGLVDVVQFIRVKNSGFFGHVGEFEEANGFLTREDLQIIAGGPPQKGQEVKNPIGQIPQIVVIKHAGRRMSLGKFLLILAQDHRQVGKFRHRQA